MPDNSKGQTTMAKVMTAKVKLQCPGGQATPAPPVGPALGQHGVNIGQFVMQFNERTKEMKGTTIPVEITIYSDRTFEFITKSPPAAVLLKQAAGHRRRAPPSPTRPRSPRSPPIRSARSPRPSSTTSTPATSSTPAGSSPARRGAWESISRDEIAVRTRQLPDCSGRSEPASLECQPALQHGTPRTPPPAGGRYQPGGSSQERYDHGQAIEAISGIAREAQDRVARCRCPTRSGC